jgi:triosephosphate isomerase
LKWLEQLVAEVDARPALAAGRVVPFVIPSFPVLPEAARLIAGRPLVLGAQNCSWADGPWTGEVSPSMLAELGVSLVEIGHAERRRYFAEDEAMIALKVSAAVDAGLTPLLCVGERETGEPAAAADTVFRQIKAAVSGDWSVASQLVIAYEPVWAIGAPEPASAEYVSQVVSALRSSLSQHGLAGIPDHLRRLGQAGTVAAAGRGVRAFPRPLRPRRRQLRQGPGRSPEFLYSRCP